MSLVTVTNVTQNGNQVTVTGVASAGAEVDLLQNGTIIESTTANNANGTFTITATVAGVMNLDVSSGGRTMNVVINIPPPGG